MKDILKINTRGNTRGGVHVIPVRPVSTGTETRASRVSYGSIAIDAIAIDAVVN